MIYIYKEVKILFFIILLVFTISCQHENSDETIQGKKEIELRQRYGNSFFISLNSDRLQEAVTSHEYLELGGIKNKGRSLSSYIPFMDDNKIFLITSDGNCSYINMYDAAGSILHTKKVECLEEISPSYLDYNSINSILTLCDPDNKRLFLYNLDTDKSEIINLPFVFFAAHFIEQNDQWVFLSVYEESGKEFTQKIIYTDIDFNPVHEILIPCENPNMPLAKSGGFKIINDELYINVWGSNSIYRLNNQTMDKVYEVPEDYHVAAGISNYFISSDFIYVSMSSEKGGYYSIYFDKNTQNSYFTPNGTIFDPIETEDYRFYNHVPQANDQDYLYLAFTKEFYDIFKSSPLDANKLSSFPNNFGSGTDLVLLRYKVDTHLLESISSREIPAYLSK